MLDSSALTALIEDPTSHSIAAAVARLIHSGELAPGDRLPTVRELAADLGISPATVSNAWQALSRAGLVVSRGRSGTLVRGAPRDWMPERYRGLDASADAALDLSRGTPDPQLLPALEGSLSRLSPRAETASYQQKPDIPELHDLLRETWPAPVESVTVTNGALDALDRVFGTVLRFGDRVVVENPGFPPIIDLLEHYGVEPVGADVDEHGMRPDSLASALSSHPAAIVLQPRAHNPTGASMTEDRAEALARAIGRVSRGAGPLVIEDDHSGQISSSPDTTLAGLLPERTLHIRSFAKSHGPDLRIGALGGPRALVDRVVSRRMLGAGWTSRMTQRLLFDLLTDDEAVATVARARTEYAARQRALLDALGAHGVRLPESDGLNLWLPVSDERAALVALAAEGIRVAPGEPFQVGTSSPHVRVTVGVLRADVHRVASALATASRAGAE
ncbi:PLP-dependent aminotransferase family protein [Amnibacterium flavum]|uniref:aminotransferase-like domain-containing protein n=1 Tax=Amnibacterium flavum TaxID=2173173 RepID=UPI001F0C2AA8|nr:aminotransferase class I/II-fold pyridoxal phosphate-dependent enzyme [Amnibacterium flavum]